MVTQVCFRKQLLKTWCPKTGIVNYSRIPPNCWVTKKWPFGWLNITVLTLFCIDQSFSVLALLTFVLGFPRGQRGPKHCQTLRGIPHLPDVSSFSPPECDNRGRSPNTVRCPLAREEGRAVKVQGSGTARSTAWPLMSVQLAIAHFWRQGFPEHFTWSLRRAFILYKNASARVYHMFLKAFKSTACKTFKSFSNIITL